MTMLLQITDMHILRDYDAAFLGVATEHYFHSVLELALSQHPSSDLILLSGDLSQDPCSAGYKRILQRITATQIPCVCLPGNHDDYELMQQVFNTSLVSCRKQLLLSNWQLISLNSQIPGSPKGQLSPQELQFLEACLVARPHHHALIAVHHHCVATQSAWLDTMIIENQQDLWSLIARYPQVKVITTGHIHQEVDCIVNNVRVLGTPSTCFQFKPKSDEFSLDDSCSPGYRVITLKDDGTIDTRVTRIPEVLQGLQMDSQGYG